MGFIYLYNNNYRTCGDGMMNTYEIWLGNKVIASVQAHSYTEARMKFADTIEVTEYE